MPELPEVETILRGVAPHIIQQHIVSVEVRDPRLRWPVDVEKIHAWLTGQSILSAHRRSKYMLFKIENGSHLVIHLGMSGRLGMFEPEMEIEKHTHVIFHFQHFQLRFRDPRRFGFVEIIEPDGLPDYPRLQHLGVEPLTDDFSRDYLFRFTQKSTKPIKNLIMDARVVVGVGNIYANESLFASGIHPSTPAQLLDKDSVHHLVQNIKMILQAAVNKGGTTLNDYRNAGGEPGYFQLDLKVYGRADEPCLTCGTAIEKVVLAGRSSFYCPRCQNKR